MARCFICHKPNALQQVLWPRKNRGRYICEGCLADRPNIQTAAIRVHTAPARPAPEKRTYGQ